MARGIRMSASRAYTLAIAIPILLLSPCALALDDAVPAAAELAGPGVAGVFGPPVQPALLYLNRCAAGCTVSPGLDSAILNRSSMVSNVRNIPAFSYGDTSWNALTKCVRRVYAPYFITVTEFDPGNVPHRELMLGGLPSAIGFPSGILGVAPWQCGAPINNAIAFVFSAAHPDDIAELCWTSTHESGHLFGLDHEFHQPDSMTYLELTTQFKHFTDADMPCGEFSPQPCNCGATQQQNTDSRLAVEQGRDRLFADGMGEDPWELPPDALVPRAMRTPQSCGTRTDRPTYIPGF